MSRASELEGAEEEGEMRREEVGEREKEALKGFPSLLRNSGFL